MVFAQNAVLILMATLIASLIFVIDLKSGSTVAVAGLYSVVILYSWLLPGRYSSIYTALGCSVLTLVSAVFSNDLTNSVDDFSGMNSVISLVVIWICVTLVFIAKNSFLNLERINRQLLESSEALLEKVKELDLRQEELYLQGLKLENLNSDLLVKNRELERFTSITSHDLQEPLRTIGNMTQLISKRYYMHFDDQGKKILDYVSSATFRMTSMIKGLLEFSRIGHNRMPQEIVDCHQLVSTILLDLDASIKAANVTSTIKNLPVIKGNPIELRLLFQNLISNSIKFRKPGVPTLVEVSAEEHPTYFQFCVRDNGIGIDPEDYDKIFYIFQRLHPADMYEGTGLGLAYCRKIVEFHGGKIWVVSEKDAGCSIFFTLNKPK